MGVDIAFNGLSTFILDVFTINKVGIRGILLRLNSLINNEQANTSLVQQAALLLYFE
jgi:hypothetical protein